MDQSPLLSLPTELLEKFVPDLNVRSIANLRSTSIRLAHVFRPFLANTLTIYVGYKHVPSTMRKKARFEEEFVPYRPPPKTLLPFIKRLTIELICCRLQYGSWQFEAVSQAIAEFTGLKRFKLAWLYHREGHTEPFVVAALKEGQEELLSAVLEATRGVLKRLVLHNPKGTPSPELLSSFLSLKKLELRIYAVDDPAAYISAARETLVRSSTLESLTFSAGTTEGDIMPIQELFPPRSVISELSLRYLQLDGYLRCQPHVPTASMPSMPQLRSLTVNQFDNDGDMDGFWDALRTTKTWIQAIDLEHCLDAALVEYLTAFNGIQRLRLGRYSKSSSTFTQSLSAILKAHAATLTHVVLAAPACLYVEHNEDKNPLDIAWPSPALFANLKYLRIERPQVWEFTRDGCQKMLNWLEKFPALEQVVTEWPMDFSRSDQSNLSSSSHNDIGSKLVGQTGRPKYWVNATFTNLLMRRTWGVMRNSRDEWSFRVVPVDQEPSLHWSVVNTRFV